MTESVESVDVAEFVCTAFDVPAALAFPNAAMLSALMAEMVAPPVTSIAKEPPTTQSEETHGRVVLEWPQYFDHSKGYPLSPMAMRVVDFDTGEELTCVRKVVIADCDSPTVVAELTLVCDEDENPLVPGAKPVLDENGAVREVTRRYAVVSMRPMVYLDPERTCGCPVISGGVIVHRDWCVVNKRERWHQP